MARYLDPLTAIQDRMGALTDLFVARDRCQAITPADPGAWYALGWLAARIDAEGVRANVSLKLTQCGVLFDRALALENARAVVREAAARGSFVRVDMEQSEVTQATLDTVRALHAEFGEEHVGAVLQSYLRRTEEDAKALCRERVRIRLCKGAYLEGPEVAFQDKRDAERFDHTLKIRLQRFGLRLAPEKTRLILFGRFARERAASYGGKKLRSSTRTTSPSACPARSSRRSTPGLIAIASTPSKRGATLSESTSASTKRKGMRGGRSKREQ